MYTEIFLLQIYARERKKWASIISMFHSYEHSATYTLSINTFKQFHKIIRYVYVGVCSITLIYKYTMLKMCKIKLRRNNARGGLFWLYRRSTVRLATLTHLRCQNVKSCLTVCVFGVGMTADREFHLKRNPLENNLYKLYPCPTLYTVKLYILKKKKT